jgi:hypothetical protein
LIKSLWVLIEANGAKGAKWRLILLWTEAGQSATMSHSSTGLPT